MVAAHEGVGTIVIIAYLALTVVNLLQLRGREISWSRHLSMGAAGLLLFQYVLGFGLLSGNHSVSAFHFIFALGALITVGLEHGMANTQESPTKRARLASAATAGTTALVIIAYAIAQSS